MSKIEKFASYFAGGTAKSDSYVLNTPNTRKFMSKIEKFAPYFAGGMVKSDSYVLNTLSFNTRNSSRKRAAFSNSKFFAASNISFSKSFMRFS
jgi:hypothetical protein